MKDFLNRAAGLFFVLCTVFIPFVHQSLQLSVTEYIFWEPVRFLRGLFHFQPGRIDFSSDTRSLLLLICFLVILAAILSIFLKRYDQKLMPVLKTVTVYFLAFVMLKYGLDKVFLRQFYQPAPNILYTPFGNLDPDILFWSTIGTAPLYQVIMGTVEVLAALLLLFSRTRFLGLLLTIISLVQIVIINIAFDISVKVFSILLLAMALYIAWTQLKALCVFLVSKTPVSLPPQKNLPLKPYLKAGLKCFIIGLMLLYTLYPQLEPKLQKPALYGAYKVEKYEVNGKSIALHNAPVKRVFVHPKYYMIFQGQDDTMADYYFTPESTTNLIELLGYNGQRQKLTYSQLNGKLLLRFENGTVITAMPLPWQKMPALQPHYHFMVDDVE